MTNLSEKKTDLMIAGILIFTAISLGAFGAHGLAKVLEPAKLETFKTGVIYQMYHALALLALAALNINLKTTKYCLMTGLLLFSGNCYIYALTGIKFFAIIIPLGGTMFLVGWLVFMKTIWQLPKK